MAPVEIVLEFMDRINKRDVDKLAELMTEDHLFVDSLGQRVLGREKMRAGGARISRPVRITGFRTRRFCKTEIWLPCLERRADLSAPAGSFRRRTSGGFPHHGWRWWKTGW